MEREAIFQRLAGILALYEPGDLMVLADLGAAIRELEDYYLASPTCGAFVKRLEAWVQQQVRGADVPDFGNRLGDALGLLQSWKPRMEPDAGQRVEAALQEFFTEPVSSPGPTASLPGPKPPSPPRPPGPGFRRYDRTVCHRGERTAQPGPRTGPRPRIPPGQPAGPGQPVPGVPHDQGGMWVPPPEPAR